MIFGARFVLFWDKIWLFASTRHLVANYFGPWKPVHADLLSFYKQFLCVEPSSGAFASMVIGGGLITGWGLG